TIALDKTGTLTAGQPSIAAFILAPNTPFDSATLIAFAAAAERLSTHPLAKAVVAFNTQRTATIPIAEDLEVLPGTGLTATLYDYKPRPDQPQPGGRKLALGNASLLTEPLPPELATPTDLAHATPLYLLLDGHLHAVFFAVDALRPTASAAIAELHA
ncbi:MAG: HAD family hydrolase, partial [Acidobacteriota bacterium]